MGAIELDPSVESHEDARKKLNAAIFDQHYQQHNLRTGRKQLGRFLKGELIADYYIDKITDPLSVNIEGQEKAMMRAEANERGFKRRRPQKKEGKKGKGKGK
jgi:Mitochondrial ribosomal subunit S27